MPKTLFVAGARRGAGKTTVAAFLLRSLPGVGAVKVTCCRPGSSCPRRNPCGVCRALSAPFAVIDDHEVLATPRKDTARLLEAAQARVVWLQAREEALAQGLRAALESFGDEPAVIVEGNAAFQAFAPDLGLLVVGAGGPAKRSVEVALPFVDGVVLNARSSSPSPAMIVGVPASARTFQFDATRPCGVADAARLVEWVAHSLGLPSAAGCSWPSGGHPPSPW